MSQDGFALLVALWLVAFITVLTGTLLVPLRTARLQVRNAVTESVARHEATSGLVHAISLVERSLSAATRGKGRAADAAARLHAAESALERLGSVTAPGGGHYRLELDDQSSRLPINRASEAELQRLLRGLGTGPLEAVEVAAALADWMDADDLHRLHGAEWDDHYSDVAGAQRPSNGPFAALSELRHVRGVDQELFEQLADVVTIDREARVNLNTASEAVIAALPGLDARAARQLVAARRGGLVFETLEQITAHLDTAARERLQARYADLRTRVSFVPFALQIVSIGTPPGSGHRPVRLEARVAATGSGFSVIRIRERRSP